MRQTKAGMETLECEKPPLDETNDEAHPNFWGTAAPRPACMSIVWRNVIGMGILHLMAVVGLFCLHRVKWQTNALILYMLVTSAWSVTAGMHRLWTHRSYKARWPLRLFLMLHACSAFQNDIFEWSRDHRVHHKFTDTDADPHNSRRGFFFCHVGWTLCRKHPDVRREGARIYLEDLRRDPIVMWQQRWYKPMVILLCFVLPTWIPVLCWGENLWLAWFTTTFRYILWLNLTFTVNSIAHLYGTRPFDRFINPAENLWVSRLTLGEGWHNYHHTFPYDYNVSELGWKWNFTSVFIDTMASVGLAYDRKTTTPEAARARALRTGDSTRYDSVAAEEEIWEVEARCTE